jgi:hypothetical protein
MDHLRLVSLFEIAPFVPELSSLVRPRRNGSINISWLEDRSLRQCRHHRRPCAGISFAIVRQIDSRWSQGDVQNNDIKLPHRDRDGF